MKSWIQRVTAVLPLLLLAALPAVAQSDAHAVLRSHEGVVVVWNESAAHFTIEIPGKKVMPSAVGGLAMLVDGWHIQVVVNDPSEFGEGATGGELIWKHAQWEAAHWSEAAGVPLEPTPIAADDILPSEFRLWEIRLPDGVKKNSKLKPKTDLFSSTLVGDRVVTLNLTVLEDQDEETAKKLIAFLSATLYHRAEAISVAEVQQALKEDG